MRFLKVDVDVDVAATTRPGTQIVDIRARWPAKSLYCLFKAIMLKRAYHNYNSVKETECTKAKQENP